jgi:BsuBI/PstI restriction endonuclease domain
VSLRLRKLVQVTASAHFVQDVTTIAGLLVDRTEVRRQAASGALEPKRRVELGQYFTPAQVADFIASLARFPERGPVRILDPGAGAGSLSASLIARLIRERPDLSVTLVACEFDDSLHEVLSESLLDCRETAAGAGVEVTVVVQPGSFIDWAAGDSLLDSAPDRLSPGGQNGLIVQIIKEFCERFTPGGKVLYIGDADEKWSVFQEDALAELGVTVDSHGKMPDVVVYLPDRNWLVLIECCDWPFARSRGRGQGRSGDWVTPRRWRR